MEDETNLCSVDSTRETSQREGDGLPDDQIRIGGSDVGKESAPTSTGRELQTVPPESPAEVEEILELQGCSKNNSKNDASVIASSSSTTADISTTQPPRKKQRKTEETRGGWRFSAEVSDQPFTPQVQITLPKDSPLHSLILPPSTTKSVGAKIKPKEKEKVPVKKKAKLVKKKPVVKKVNYKCGACGKRCATLEMVKSHLCVPRLQCLDCLPSEVILPNRQILLHHLNTDHPNLCLPCKQCDQEFHSQTLLKWHTKVHEVERQKKEEEVTQAVTDALEAAIASEKLKTTPQPEVVKNMALETADDVEVTPQEVTDEFHATEELDDLPSESVVELEVPVTTIPETSDPEPVVNIVEISRRDEEIVDSPSTPSTPITHSSHRIQPLAAPLKSPTFECSKCKKTFNTRLRFNNHRLRCGIEVKKEPIMQRPAKKENTRWEYFLSY